MPYIVSFTLKTNKCNVNVLHRDVLESNRSLLLHNDVTVET